MEPRILSVPAGLPDPPINSRCLFRIVHRPEQAAFFQGKQNVLRIEWNEATQNSERLAVAVFAAQKQKQHDPGVHTVLAIASCHLVKVFDPFVLAAAQADQSNGYLYSPG